MGINDQLFVVNEMHEEDLIKLFLDCVGEALPITKRDGDIDDREAIAVMPDLCIISAMPIHPRMSYKSRIDMNVPVHLDFRLDKGNWHAARENILGGLVEMLKRVPWDMAWVHNYDTVALLRKSGKVILKRDDAFWTPERLKLVTVPFEIAELPVL